MNARLLAAFLCLATLGTGCIIIDNDGGNTQTGSPGNVTFVWTFGAGYQCDDVPEVKSVKIVIPGESLDNNGFYACNTLGTDGITLRNFRAGIYNYTIDALDSRGAVLYKTTGSFRVNGNVMVTADLTPNGKPYAYLSWSFPANSASSNPTCLQANVNRVTVSVDNGPAADLDCTAGMVNGGVPSSFLEPGNHTITLVAYGRDKYNRDGMPLYSAQGTMTLPRSGSISVSYRFFEGGGMSLKWLLWDGYANKYKNCTEAGLTGIRINLLDMATNNPVFGTAGDPHGCADAPVVYNLLKPGQYKVFIRGLVDQTITYTNEYDSTPTILTVAAFDARTGTDPSETISISRR
jgi:hypothetical protein